MRHEGAPADRILVLQLHARRIEAHGLGVDLAGALELGRPQRASSMNCARVALSAPEPAPAAVHEITRSGNFAASISAV